MRIRAWVVVALIGLACLGCAKKRRDRQTAVPVTVAVAEVRSVPHELEANGTVEPLRSVSVLSQVAGILTHVAFREGADVRQGQVLFQIDPRPLRAALAQAQATLSRDRAQLASALPDAERYRDLAEKGYVTQSDYEAKRAVAEALRSTVRADSAAVVNARLNLAYATIRAPISGRTGSLLNREGNLVKSGGTEPLVVINQVRPILVRFSLPERHLNDILRERGRRLAVLVGDDEDGTPPKQGTLVFVDNNVDASTGTILLKAELPNSDAALWPGEFVKATLILSVDPTAIVVPAQAVTSGQAGGTSIFVVQADATVESRPVTVTRTVGDLAVIASGVRAGEQVVTDGQFRLAPGSKVTVKGREEEGPSDSSSAGAGAVSGGTPAAAGASGKVKSGA